MGLVSYSAAEAESKSETSWVHVNLRLLVRSSICGVCSGVRDGRWHEQKDSIFAQYILTRFPFFDIRRLIKL